MRVKNANDVVIKAMKQPQKIALLPTAAYG